jgi:hypothetical protein
MSTNISIRSFTVEDFVSVDHGAGAISLTFFQGKFLVGSPGWATTMQLDPDQAEAIGKELISRAEKVRQKPMRRKNL